MMLDFPFPHASILVISCKPRI